MRKTHEAAQAQAHDCRFSYFIVQKVFMGDRLLAKRRDGTKVYCGLIDDRARAAIEPYPKRYE